MGRTHQQPNPEIGKRLLEARVRSGLTQRQLAKLTPYTAAYVSRLEAGARTPTINFLEAVAPHLHVSVSWLQTGQDIVDLHIPRGLAEMVLEHGYRGAGGVELGVILQQALGDRDGVFEAVGLA